MSTLKERMNKRDEKIKNAAIQILELAEKLHLTWREFEDAVKSIQCIAEIRMVRDASGKPIYSTGSSMREKSIQDEK